MNTRLFALGCCLFIAACGSHQDTAKLNDQFLSAARKYYDAHRDSLNTIDSFLVTKIDTLTEKDINNYRYQDNNRMATLLSTKVELLSLEYKQSQLYASLGIKNTDKKEIQDSLAGLKIELDTITKRDIRYRNFDKIADSTTFIHYLVTFRIVETKPDNTQLKNELSYIINKDFRVELPQQYLEH